MKADYKYCVNAEKVKGPMKKRYPGSWCYVDASCSELGGGKPVNSRVSYKMCQSGSGESLGEFTPKELFALTERIHADAQMMALMSYEWRGPKEGRGSLLDVAYNASTAGLVGASRKSDTFTVVYKGEVWEISDGATCVKGCS